MWLVSVWAFATNGRSVAPTTKLPKRTIAGEREAVKSTALVDTGSTDPDDTATLMTMDVEPANTATVTRFTRTRPKTRRRKTFGDVADELPVLRNNNNKAGIQTPSATPATTTTTTIRSNAFKKQEKEEENAWWLTTSLGA